MMVVCHRGAEYSGSLKAAKDWIMEPIALVLPANALTLHSRLLANGH